jgi:hypothetical protein
MKIVKNKSNGIVFQGDIAMMRVDSLPKDAKPEETQVVAHSETGHHHLAERAKVFSVPDGEVLYMQALGKSIDIVHKRNYDTHETIRLLGEPGQIWKIRRQREHTPEGWRRVED